MSAREFWREVLVAVGRDTPAWRRQPDTGPPVKLGGYSLRPVPARIGWVATIHRWDQVLGQAHYVGRCWGWTRRRVQVRAFEQARRIAVTDQRVLEALKAVGAQNGYQLMQSTGFTGGQLHVVLARLERTGAVTSRWVEGPYPRKRVYELAPVDPGSSGHEGDVRFGIKVENDNGHHVHFRLYAATDGQHLGSCGTLTMTPAEYAVFRQLLGPKLTDRPDPPPAPRADAQMCSQCHGRGLVPVGDDGELYECGMCDGVGGFL